MSVDLIDFLRARLDEDQRAAELALGRPGMDPTAARRNPMVVMHLNEARILPFEDDDYGRLFDSTARVVPSERMILESKDARVIYDPERMLREVKAKRAILAEHWTTSEVWGGDWVPACGRCTYGDDVRHRYPCPTLLALAAIYSDHPDYRSEWRP